MSLEEKARKYATQIKDFYLGTTEELKTKVNPSFARTIYLIEGGMFGLWLAYTIDGKLNPYITPFAIDGAFRMADGLIKGAKKYKWDMERFELQGIAGLIKGCYQKYKEKENGNSKG